MKKISLMFAAFCCMMMVFTACNNKPEVKELSFDPLLEWGCSLADVEAHIAAKPWHKDGNDSLEYWENYEGWHKWYWVSEEYRLTEQYLYETQNGQNMFCAMCYCWNKEISIEKGQDALLKQGYKIRERTNAKARSEYVSPDGRTEAYLFKGTNAWWVEFWPIIY